MRYKIQQKTFRRLHLDRNVILVIQNYHVVWVIKIIENWVYIKQKQVCTESKELSLKDLKATE